MPCEPAGGTCAAPLPLLSASGASGKGAERPLQPLTEPGPAGAGEERPGAPFSQVRELGGSVAWLWGTEGTPPAAEMEVRRGRETERGKAENK